MLNNKKGEFKVGVLLVVAVGVIVAMVLLQASAQQIGSTNTLEVTTNGLVTFPNSAAGLVLNGRAVQGSVVVTNRTGGEVVPASNYTVTNNVIQSDGTLAPVLRTAGAVPYNGTNVNVTYTYQPDTYDDSSAGRSVAGLIILFAALGAAVYVFSAIDIKELMGN